MAGNCLKDIKYTTKSNKTRIHRPPGQTRAQGMGGCGYVFRSILYCIYRLLNKFRLKLHNVVLDP